MDSIAVLLKGFAEKLSMHNNSVHAIPLGEYRESGTCKNVKNGEKKSQTIGDLITNNKHAV